MQTRYYCYDCAKTIITAHALSEEDKMCNCATPRKMRFEIYMPKAVPLSAELQQSYSVSAASAKRAELCKAWGIANKSHAYHKGNFDANQTLKQLIDNIVAPVPRGTEWERVRGLVASRYRYDISTQSMT